jgi:feruloyl esterase
MTRLRAAALAATTAGLALAIVTATTSSGADSPSVPVAPAIAPKLACGDLVQSGGPPRPGVPDFSQIPDAPARVSSATVVGATATAPELCDVKGYVAPQVQFELKLPTKSYQGRYLQAGCGGFCGSITPTTFPACDAELGGDFALSTTDDGHAGASGFDAVWAANDRQLRIDMYFRAVHVTAVASKAIIAAFYGQAPRYSYFNGCSEGGREGLMEAQRYPDDFDGIVAGAPAAYWSPLNAEYQPWNARSNTAPDGSSIITPAKLPALHQAVIAACDAKDGLADGEIEDPRDCAFDPGSIQCPGATDQPTCLTDAQVQAARRLYGGPRDQRGRRLYPGGEPLGSELQWMPWVATAPGTPASASIAAQAGENFLRYLAFPVGRPGSSIEAWRFTDQEFDRLRAEERDANALDPDLRAFRRHGGKLILFHGWADPAISPFGTPAYYQAVEDTMGGAKAVQRFARLFMIPTMYHCNGGYGPSQFDMVGPIVDWVEQDKAPDAVIVSQTDASGKVARTRPVFPYPERARYAGSGSIDDAASFVAADPTAPPDDHVDWLGSDLLRSPGPHA